MAGTGHGHGSGRDLKKRQRDITHPILHQGQGWGETGSRRGNAPLEAGSHLGHPLPHPVLCAPLWCPCYRGAGDLPKASDPAHRVLGQPRGQGRKLAPRPTFAHSPQTCPPPPACSQNPRPRRLRTKGEPTGLVSPNASSNCLSPWMSYAPTPPW